jgi:hypothetical protein
MKKEGRRRVETHPTKKHNNKLRIAKRLFAIVCLRINGGRKVNAHGTKVVAILVAAQSMPLYGTVGASKGGGASLHLDSGIPLLFLVHVLVTVRRNAVSKAIGEFA